MWIGLGRGLGARRPGPFRPRISTWVRGHGCRQALTGLRSPAARATARRGRGESVCGRGWPGAFIFSCGVTGRVRIQGPFLLEQEDTFRYHFPDRADASRRRLGGRGREQPSVETSATRHDLHLSARETGLTGT